MEGREERKKRVGCGTWEIGIRITDVMHLEGDRGGRESGRGTWGKAGSSMCWVLAVALCLVAGVQGQLGNPRPMSVQELGFGCLLDMCIAVDSSHSLDSQGFQQELDFLEKLVDFIDGMADEVKAHYAAVVFSTNVSVHFDFSETRTKEEVKEKLQQIPYIRGRTNIPDAMEQCRMLLQFSPSKRYADIGAYIVTLVLTDGVANEGIPHPLELF
ncbi:uncharacterized protein LOC106169233 [Lingula anatina]|uniref:Uncharacterized protein LOC106169233 n=1 Tax=Lingula anatina TaxID=7574 RepID=A0A2R2MN62_LINAN|nr:uncharacterized protein LOC106169233 [Lingula anatina]|eukprot:XP_023931651.1 uncharacterized protein LOC106169233 [Lingula anatina]